MTCKVKRGRKRTPVIFWNHLIWNDIPQLTTRTEWALPTPDEVLFFPERVCLVCKPCKVWDLLKEIKYAFKRCLIQKVWFSIFFSEISSKWPIRSLLSITELCCCSRFFEKLRLIIDINWYRKHWLSYSHMNIFAPKETLPTYSCFLQPSDSQHQSTKLLFLAEYICSKVQIRLIQISAPLSNKKFPLTFLVHIVDSHSVYLGTMYLHN